MTARTICSPRLGLTGIHTGRTIPGLHVTGSLHGLFGAGASLSSVRLLYSSEGISEGVMEGGRDGSSRWDSGEQDGGKERTRTRLRKRIEERREENGAMISLLKRLLEFRGGEEIKEVIEHGEEPARQGTWGEKREEKRL